MFLGTKHDLRAWARSCPLTLALSPNTENVSGEREEMVGLGYRLTPRWGSIRKKRPPAASQMSNLQILSERSLRRSPERVNTAGHLLTSMATVLSFVHYTLRLL